MPTTTSISGPLVDPNNRIGSSTDRPSPGTTHLVQGAMITNYLTISSFIYFLSVYTLHGRKHPLLAHYVAQDGSLRHPKATRTVCNGE